MGVAILRLAAVSAVLFCMVPFHFAAATSVPGPQGFADLAAGLLPAVVNVSTSATIKRQPGDGDGSDQASPFDEFFKDFMDRHNGGEGDAAPVPRKAISLGSGFVIDPAGLIVTNNHVIQDADEVSVILTDDTHVKAEIVGRDVQTDLALLRIKTNHRLAAVHWGDSDAMHPGDWVLAVGNPFGLGGTMTAGIISARSRAINNDGPYDDFLQTDASINRGNSGGPLFDMRGRVIGINSAIYSPSGGSIGIGFAIPATLASHVIDQLRRYGRVRRGWLGLRLQPLDRDAAGALGLAPAPTMLVAAIAADGPAAKAGLRPGDAVLAVDGKPVTDVRRYQQVIGDANVDGPVTLSIVRNGERRSIVATVAEAKEQEAAAPDAPEETRPSVPDTVTVLGMALATATSDLREKYQLGDGAPVVVLSVSKGSGAGDRLKPGDAIVDVGGAEVKTPADVAARVAAARKAGHKSVLLLVDRHGDLSFVGLDIDKG